MHASCRQKWAAGMRARTSMLSCVTLPSGLCPRLTGSTARQSRRIWVAMHYAGGMLHGGRRYLLALGCVQHRIHCRRVAPTLERLLQALLNEDRRHREACRQRAGATPALAGFRLPPAATATGVVRETVLGRGVPESSWLTSSHPASLVRRPSACRSSSQRRSRARSCWAFVEKNTVE